MSQSVCPGNNWNGYSEVKNKESTANLSASHLENNCFYTFQHISKQSQLASLCFRADTNYAFSFSSLHGGYGKAEGWVGLSAKLAHQQPLPHTEGQVHEMLAWYVYSYSPSPSSVPPLVTPDSYDKAKLKVTASFPFLLRVQLTLTCFHVPYRLNTYHGKIWNDTQSARIWAPTKCHKREGNPIHDLR